MSRSGYDYEWTEQSGLYRQAVDNAIRGKRGQAFLREMLAARHLPVRLSFPA